MEAKANNRYQSNVFINQPTLLQGHTVQVLFERTVSETQPLISIVTPVHNQEQIIVRNMKSIFKNTTNTPYEYLLIIDCCQDQSKEVILSFLKGYTLPKFCVRLVVFYSETPLFETTADNLGFYCAAGQYILEIQADMEMTERGYNETLLKPFFHPELSSQLLGVSGRCCHRLINCEGVGKLGMGVEKTLSELQIDRTKFYMSETCNRGPLMLHRSRLQELGYLDEANFYLDDSDHDLFARAYHFKKWVCGYMPIEFSSPLCDGSTRKKRDHKNTAWLKKRQEQSKGGFLNTYRTQFYQPRPIVSISMM